MKITRTSTPWARNALAPEDRREIEATDLDGWAFLGTVRGEPSTYKVIVSTPDGAWEGHGRTVIAAYRSALRQAREVPE